MAENRALIPEPVAMYTQTETLKDNELSKNLVSGDFERQYRAGMMEKPGRRQQVLGMVGVTVAVIIGVTIGALACWVLVRSWAREGEIARLRREVDELSANMILLAANVKFLNENLNNTILSDSKSIDDTIYADEDVNPNWTDEIKRPNKKEDGSLEKLDGITVTVLEDNTNLPDDEDDDDMYSDDEDSESGDWYADYDTRRPKDGTSSMVRLSPDDFTDTVVNAKHSDLMELKRRLNEDPENPDIGFPSLKGSTESSDSSRNKRSVFPDYSAEAVNHHAAPTAVSKDEERRKTKKFNPAVDAPLNKVTLHAITRTVRSEDQSTRGRPFIAAHFHGNTSHLNTEIHEHYKGNGLLRVAHDKPHDVWYPSPWTIASPHPRPTLTRNGHVHVHHTGVYLVYVQIYYLDSHDIISWVLHRTNSEIEGRETLLQCAQSAHSPEPMDKPNSCFSAAALFLKAGDRLAVRNTGGDRHSLMQPEKSFIGLIKLADAEDPNDEEF